MSGPLQDTAPERRRRASPPVESIDADIDAAAALDDPAAAATRLLALSEEVLERWILARGETPTAARREHFRLLALHHQGTRNAPSFNACRETCREIAYHYNLLCGEPRDARCTQRQRMMSLLVRHLALFVAGKMEVEKLGEFCCASRPLRTADC
ncbi:MAG TPA: hypothetical protein VL742_00925 [Casimicrobiaceae bacterium]|nr:hypothetical protein [Casimicrobiaceae bacterium]